MKRDDLARGLRATILVSAAAVLAACSSGGGSTDTGGGGGGGGGGGTPEPGAADFATLETEFDRIMADRFAASNLATSDLPDTGSASYSGVLTYRMFPSDVPGVVPDYPADNETAGELMLDVSFGSTNEVTGSATGFVTNEGDPLTGTLTSVPGGTINNDLFPMSVTLEGELIEIDGEARDLSVDLSGILTGDGELEYIDGVVEGTMTTAGASYADLEGEFAVELD